MVPAGEIETLRQQLTQAEAVIAELRDVVAELRQRIESQQAHIHRLVHLTFGRSSERVEGPTLFDAILLPETEPAKVEVEPVPPEPERPARRRGHGRKAKPTDLPRQRTEVDLGEAEKLCPCCGTARVRIGQTVRERLDYQPASVFIREYVLPTYACRVCERQGLSPQIARATPPPEPVPKSNIGAGLLAHVIVSKCVDHLPLYRQVSILARHGFPVRRSRLCDLLADCGRLLAPLFDRMKERLLLSFALHADDTALTLLRPKRTAYAWLYLGDVAHPYTLFDFTPGRSEEFPQQFLTGYTGFVHADAYSGYNAVHGHQRHLGCWMHVRRKFVEARDNDPRVIDALAFIRTLYAVEREIREDRAKPDRGVTDAEVVHRRQTRAGPILDMFSDWLDRQHLTATPKSLFGQAVEYARNQTLTSHSPS
jgi:transposase